MDDTLGQTIQARVQVDIQLLEFSPVHWAPLSEDLHIVYDGTGEKGHRGIEKFFDSQFRIQNSECRMAEKTLSKDRKCFLELIGL